MHRIVDKLDRFFNGKWRLAVLDVDCGRWISSPKYLAYLKAENAKGRHILIQPAPDIEPYYLLADDLTYALLTKQHKEALGRNNFKPGRMVIETSPHNYQVWIHSSRPLDLNEKRYWLKKLHSDPAADPNHRWGRCPGFYNRKEKYRNEYGGYPLAKLIWVDFKNTARIPFAPLISTPQKDKNENISLPPLGGVCQYSRKDYERGDESATDFSYALALARRKFSYAQIKQKILEERTDWKNHNSEKRKNLYLDVTISKALKIIG